jgi:hypothetical protein
MSDKPKYLLFYVESNKVFGCFYNEEEELLKGWVEDVELQPEDIEGYLLTGYEKNLQGRIVFYAVRGDEE